VTCSSAESANIHKSEEQFFPLMTADQLTWDPSRLGRGFSREIWWLRITRHEPDL